MADEMFEREYRQKLGNLYSGEGRSRVETEVILPEYKEEAQRIIRMDPSAKVTHKNLYLRGQNLICEIDGIVSFHILYLTDRRGEKGVTSSFLSKENFSYTFKVPFSGEEFDPNGAVCFVEMTPESSAVKLQGPRSIHARCDVALSLDLKCNQPIVFFPEEISSDIITKGKKVKIARLAANHTEEMSFSETIALPKAYLPIEEVCEMDVNLFAQNVEVEDGGVRFMGLCDLHCSYTAKGEDLFVSFYQPIEFEKKIGIGGVESGHFCRVHMTPNFLKATTDINEEGENKNILFEVGFTCEVLAFENEESLLIEDAFSTDCKLLIEKEKEHAEEIVGISDFSATVKDQIPLKNTAIFRAEGIRSSVEFMNSYLDDGKICLEGKLLFRYLGIEESGEMKNFEDSFDFKCDLTVGGIKIPSGEECRIEIFGGVRSLELEPDGEKLRLRFDLGGCVTVYVRHYLEILSRIERGEKHETCESGILFVYPEEGEDLWSLAKAYHISPEKLTAQNALTEDTLPPFIKIIR